ncbi:MAG: translation initiation factor IF-2, partial [Clostridia bacterium]|nr:translation initiation factor IF-2 [Clostridia bacterium]
MTRDFSADYDEDRVVRKARSKRTEQAPTVVAPKITHAIITTQEVPIKVLSEKIGVSASEIIKQLFKEGIMKTINDSVDFDYAEYIASLHEVTLELRVEKTAEEIITGAGEDDGLENDTKRPPIVTVMGHVDHGKTSLLDAIRDTSVTSGEAGGITQHIGAYTVKKNGELITFIDTPGHAAFTAMRARGAKITDVAIIVVAADDGVMPQTIEAINHAKAAGVSIVVAINKMDKPHVDPDRVKQQLTEYELLAEEWGGDTIMVPVSAKTGMGIDTLLESVLLVTEIKELKANPKKRATGTIIEAKLDKGRGPVATILVANGTLNVGDYLIAGAATGKIRAMFDDKGRKVKSAGPSMPVEVLGFSEVPQAGDFMYVADEKLVKKAAEERRDKIRM